MKTWLVGLALACLHCTPSQGCTSWEGREVAYVLVEDQDNFSSEQLRQIRECLDEWETALHGELHFELVSAKGPEDLIVIRAASRAEIQAEYGTDASTDFVPWERGGGITLPSDVTALIFHQLLLHELGHALGLDHDETPGAIMQPWLGPQQDQVTCADVEQFCSYNACTPETWPICQF